MAIARIIPEIRATDLPATMAFYRELGLEVAMEADPFLLFTVPEHPKLQLMANADPRDTPVLPPGFTIDLGDGNAVTQAYDRAVEDGRTIVETIYDKPWGIRRFSLLDPSGCRVTLLAHL